MPTNRILLMLVFLVATGQGTRATQESKKEETAEEFIARVNKELDDLGKEAAAAWVRATYITPDTAVLAAKAQSRFLEYQNRVVEESRRYLDEDVGADAARSLRLLKLQDTRRPAPADAAKREELTDLYQELTGAYGEGKYCPGGEDTCRTLPELERVLAENRDYDELLDAWQGWRTVSPPMRGSYTRFAELANEGARNLGFQDLGQMWRSAYDMSPDAFAQETERLWSQVEPLYEQLHCYVRARLGEHYGEGTKSPPMDPSPPISSEICGRRSGPISTTWWSPIPVWRIRMWARPSSIKTTMRCA